MTTANRLSKRRLQKETTAPRRSSLSTTVASCTNLLHSFISSDPFPSSALPSSLGAQRLYHSPAPRPFPSITTTRPVKMRSISPSASHEASKIKSRKRSLSLPTLGPSFHSSQLLSQDEVSRNNAPSEQPFLQSDEPSASNERRL